MSNRPDAKFLEELGWLTVQWSGLELMIELTCAYLYKAGMLKVSGDRPPKPFNARVKCIREALKLPAFTHLRDDYGSALDIAMKLSVERNDRMHGAFTSWNGGSGIKQTMVKSGAHGYAAIQDIEITIDEVAALAKQVRLAFGVHFNLHDRLKATLRLFEGQNDIGRRSIIDQG
jgi:hypothetical protein